MTKVHSHTGETPFGYMVKHGVSLNVEKRVSAAGRHNVLDTQKSAV